MIQKPCDYCDNMIVDGEDVGFIAYGKFGAIPSERTYAIHKDFQVDELYHKECLKYVLGTCNR